MSDSINSQKSLLLQGMTYDSMTLNNLRNNQEL